MVGVILFAGIELSPDEAQYWTWSQRLDFGYYSKPPGIAWQIFLSTQIFGSTEFGVRFFSICYSFALGLLIYFLALKSSLSPRGAFWCGLMFALSPLGFLSSLMAITDVGFVFFWTVCCLIVAQALQNHKAPHPLIIGFMVMMGALYKWPMYLFWIFYVPFWRAYFPFQKLSHVIFAIAFSLLALVPSAIWNIQHDFSTFKHVFTTLRGGNNPNSSPNILEFLGNQFLLLSPILFVMLLLSFVQTVKKWKTLSPQLQFYAVVTISLLIFGSLLSLHQKIQGNWMAFAYSTGIVLIGWLAYEFSTTKWTHCIVKIAIVINIILGLIAFSLPSFFTHSNVLPWRMNPFKQNMGWNILAEKLNQIGYDPNTEFLVSDTYQVTSELSFYAPGQHIAYFLNLDERRNNQFVYWPSLNEKELGKTGYFVYTVHPPHFGKEWKNKLLFFQDTLPHYFEKVTFISQVPLLSNEQGALIFRCESPINSPIQKSHKY